MDEQDLGRIIGKLEGQLETFTEQNKEANASRKIIHDKLSKIEAQVSHMDTRLTELEPIVGQFSKWRERGIGVFLFLSFVLTAFGALVAVMWEKIIHAIGLK